MMKKISIIAILAALVISHTTFCSEEFFGDSPVSFREYSSFYVTLPIMIEPDVTSELSVTMDSIEDGYHVEVYATNLDGEGLVTVTSGNNTGKLALVKDNGSVNVDGSGFIASFSPEIYTDVAITNLTVMRTGERLKPGVYTGSVSFRVSCVKD